MYIFHFYFNRPQSDSSFYKPNLVTCINIVLLSLLLLLRMVWCSGVVPFSPEWGLWGAVSLDIVGLCGAGRLHVPKWKSKHDP